MEKILRSLRIVAGTLCLLSLTYLFLVTASVVKRLPDLVESEMVLTRALVSNEMGKARTELRAGLDKVDKRVESIQGELMVRLDRTEADLNAQISAFSGAVLPIATKVDDALPLFLDCEYNPDCLFNRWVGFSRGVEDTAMAVGEIAKLAEESAPQLLENANAITTNVGQITQDVSEAVHEFTHPPWYKRVLSGLAVAGSVVIHVIK